VFLAYEGAIMSDRTSHPLELILAHEDLDQAARARADAHLASCAECRELLTRLRDLEARAAGVDGLHHGGDDDPLGALSEAERAAAVRSRQALVARLPRAHRPRRSRRLVTGAAGALALAAVLVLMVTGPWRGGDSAHGPVLGDLRLAPAVVARDAAGPAGEGVPGGASGAPVTVRFTPVRAGWPLVVRVDAAGTTLLTPTPAGAGWRVAANRPAVLPPPGSGVTWRAAPAGEAVCWVVALAGDPLADPAAVAREIRQVAAVPQVAGQDGVDAAAERVRSWLAGRFAGAAVVGPGATR
jgi:hypothetical protein